MKKLHVITNKTVGLFLFPFLLVATGCALQHTAVQPVSPEMQVAVDYTCRLQDGRLAASTLPSAGKNEESSSTIFQPYESSGPVILAAGVVPECPECDRSKRYFDLVLREGIQKQLAGVRYGQPVTMHIATDELLMDEVDGQISVRRHQTRPKVKPIMLEQVTDYLGRTPEIGEVIQPPNQSDWPVKVLEVAEPHVVIEQLPVPGKPWITPFGPASFMDNGEEFFLSITPDMGHLVRSGGLIGRVVNVSDEAITLDYRHPFGYEELTCDVTVHEAPETDEEKHAATEAK